MEADGMVTILASETGKTKALTVSLTKTTVKELLMCAALMGLTGPNLQILKDGNPLTDPLLTLEEAGVQNGDLLVAERAKKIEPMTPAAGGGLDFSNLLAKTNLNNGRVDPLYYAGMSLREAKDYNSKPEHIVKLLLTHSHLFKELNFHDPQLAGKLRGHSYEKAVQIWREELMKGGLHHGIKKASAERKEEDMKLRLQKNPKDVEAKEYFESKKREKMVAEQYTQMMEEYPESQGRVLMLYIQAMVNGHSLPAFVDTGFQKSFMSKATATLCGLMDQLDTRFKGLVVGCGTNTILGQVHIVNLQLQNYHFPLSIDIMDDPPSGAKDIGFIIGLDMIKRHTCSVDLENHVLKFRLGPGHYLETPFLHEKDLTTEMGGTKDFDAEKSNKELEEMQQKNDEFGDEKKSDSDDSNE